MASENVKGIKRPYIIADNIAEKLCQKDNRDFWKNIKHNFIRTNKKVKLPTNIDGVHGDNDIVSMWKQNYAAIFNSVENSSCDQAHSDFCNTNIAFDNDMTVDLFEMKAVILLLLSYIIVSYIQLSLLEPCSGQWPNFEEASFGWWSM